MSAITPYTRAEREFLFKKATAIIANTEKHEATVRSQAWIILRYEATILNEKNASHIQGELSGISRERQRPGDGDMGG